MLNLPISTGSESEESDRARVDEIKFYWEQHFEEDRNASSAAVVFSDNFVNKACFAPLIYRQWLSTLRGSTGGLKDGFFFIFVALVIGGLVFQVNNTRLTKYRTVNSVCWCYFVNDKIQRCLRIV